MKKVFWIGLIVVIIGLGIFLVNNIFNDENIWKVEITNTYINVRDNHLLSASKIKTVKQNKSFEVISTYLEDEYYVWYEIKVDDYTTGWIASERNHPYVKEINNPQQENEESYFIDYICPIIKFYDTIYYEKNIESIKYDHLTIEDDSQYTITNEIYFDEFPKDKNEAQYFIKYIVTDSFGNVSTKIQQIEFLELPENDQVLDIEEL